MKYTKIVTQKLLFFKININKSVQSVYSCKENKFYATLQCFNVYFSDIIWQPCPQWADKAWVSKICTIKNPKWQPISLKGAGIQNSWRSMTPPKNEK